MKLTGFENRIALVTGAAGGIGQSLCHMLAETGATVLATDTEEGVDHVPRSDRTRFTWQAMDVSDAAVVEATLNRAERDMGPIDLLAHAAGIVSALPLAQTTPADWARVIGVNATGTFNVCNGLARRMQPRQRGAIVVVGSNAAGIPRDRMGAYAASKAAAHMFVRCLGLELGRDGIRCNLVAPGSTLTPMQTRLWPDAGGAERVIAGDLETYRTGIPLGKLAKPDDVAAAALFLLSEQAGHVTMADLYVDGGATLRA